MAHLVHVNVVARARIGLGPHAVDTGSKDHSLHQIGVGSAVGQAQLEPAGTRNADHMGAVVAGPGHRVGRPGCPGRSPRRIDAFIAVHGRIADRGQGAGVFHDPAKKVAALIRQAQLFGRIGEGVLFAIQRPDRDMRVTSRTRQTLERLWHEGGAQPVLFSHRLHHEFEKAVLVGGLQHVVILPVHLVLSGRVFVVVLVGLPAQLQHVIANLRDHVILAHHCLLVVARLFGVVIGVGNPVAFGGQQEKLGLDAGLDAQALFGGLVNQTAQDVARCLFDRLFLHHAVGGEPGNFFLPGQLNGGIGIRHRHHVGMGRGQVQPGGKAGKARAVNGHVVDRLSRHQFGALTPEKIGVGNHEILDALVLGPFGEIFCHRC